MNLQSKQVLNCVQESRGKKTWGNRRWAALKHSSTGAEIHKERLGQPSQRLTRPEGPSVEAEIAL